MIYIYCLYCLLYINIYTQSHTYIHNTDDQKPDEILLLAHTAPDNIVTLPPVIIGLKCGTQHVRMRSELVNVSCLDVQYECDTQELDMLSQKTHG